MNRFRSREARLLDIIETAYTVSNEADMVCAVFAALHELIPFASGVFMPVDPDTLQLRSGISFNCDPARMATYLAHYAALDPFVLRRPSPTLLNQTVLLSDVISSTELESSAFGSFMREVPYSHAAATIIAVEEQPVAAFSVHRQHHDKDFSAKDCAIVDQIGPHLARAVTLRRLANNPTQRGQTGILVFSVGGEALYVNATASRYLGQMRPSVLLAALAPQGPGCTEIESQHYRVSQLPWAAASLLRRFAVDEATASTNEVESSSREAVGCWAAATRGASAAIIVAVRPFCQRTETSRRLRHYGLSPRQSAVAERVCRGLTNLDIAIQLGISERTVKDHLVAVFRILGIGSRTALIGKVMGGFGDRPPRTKQQA